jgi:hypothetical protein
MNAALLAGLLAGASATPTPGTVASPASPSVTAPTGGTATPATPPPVIQPVIPRHRIPPSAAELRVRAANHAATLEPQAAGYIDAIQVYPFSDGAIFHVFTAPGQVTDIALQPGETLGAVAAGDTVRWVIGDTTSGSGDGKRTHVLAKPFAAGRCSDVVARGSEVSLGSLLKNELVERQVGDCPTEPKVLLLQILHPPRLIDLQAAIFLAPPVIGLLGDTDPPTPLGGRPALAQHDLDLTQLPDDLLGFVLLRRHVTFLSW